MKVCRFEGGYGLVVGNEVVDVTALVPPTSGSGDPLVRALPKLRALSAADLAKCPRRPLSSMPLLSPVAAPTKILAAPNNYREHTHEMEEGGEGHGRFANMAEAGFFLKATSSLVGPSQGIAQRFLERRTDYEIELVAVIGKAANKISESNALDYIAAYALGLDVTLRGPEERSLRKSIDTYTVLGPWLVTSDEIADLQAVELTLTQNGEPRQHTRVSNMVFTIAQQIEYVSRFYTLHPGDLIYTGTPDGVGPIRPGDVLKAVGTGLGVLEVRVRDAERG